MMEIYLNIFSGFKAWNYAQIYLSAAVIFFIILNPGLMKFVWMMVTQFFFYFLTILVFTRVRGQMPIHSCFFLSMSHISVKTSYKIWIWFQMDLVPVSQACDYWGTPKSHVTWTYSFAT